MNLPTQGQVIAAGRHVATSVASVIGTLAAVKLLSGGDAASLQTSIDQFSHGVAEIFAAVSAIVVTVSGAYAALSANPIVQMLKGLLSIAKDPSKIEQVKDAASIEQKAALVATTNNLDSVKGVPLQNTSEGLAIQTLVPSQAVAVVK